MSDHTKIQWTEATWNPVTGCTKVSAGCKNCYAKRDWARLSANPKTVYYGREFEDVQCHPERLDQPLHWAKPRRIFVNSMSDLFHEDVPFAFIREIFSVMEVCPQHTFQILTKRPMRMMQFINAAPPPNVWLGISVEDQDTANQRIPLLLLTLAKVRFVSVEPLLAPITLFDLHGPIDVPLRMDPLIDWVIVGGESGPNARPMHLDWARSLRDQCTRVGVPFFFKQWGEYWPAMLDQKPGEAQPWRTYPYGLRAWSATEFISGGVYPEVVMRCVGKKSAGRLLDGIEYSEYPK